MSAGGPYTRTDEGHRHNWGAQGRAQYLMMPTYHFRVMQNACNAHQRRQHRSKALQLAKGRPVLQKRTGCPSSSPSDAPPWGHELVPWCGLTATVLPVAGVSSSYAAMRQPWPRLWQGRIRFPNETPNMFAMLAVLFATRASHQAEACPQREQAERKSSTA